MTQEQKYTPGPWAISRNTSMSVVGKNDRPVCSTGGYQDNRVDSSVLLAENEANARLIAAAPDLYEALKEADAELETLACAMGLTSELVAVCERVKAALAKAEGKS